MRNVLLGLLLAFVSIIAGCSSVDSKGETANRKTEVVFWHSMSGDLQPVLEEIVNDFNQTHSDIEVKPVFQGTYEEALTKWNAVAGTKEAPTIMQTFEVGTKHMIDSGQIVPVQTWIDKDQYDVSQWEKNIVRYYTVNGRIYSMPFNSSTPVLIYNKDAFRKAGLDPEKPPLTYSELKEAAKKLTKKSGKETKQYGFSMLNYGWFFEEMIAVQGGLYVNHDNGRSADATEAVFHGQEGRRVFELIRDMYRDGTFYNAGQNWDDMRAAFQAGKIAMYLDSSAGLKSLIDNSPFSVGVSYLPVPDGIERQGVVIGGASLWMMKGSSEKEQKAAWEFMKYVTSPSVQAKWHVRTGYFAINPAAYDEPLVKEEWKKYPQLKVAVDQLHETKPTAATQGALITVFPESRQHVVKAMEQLYEGVDPQEALDQAAKETNRVLQKTN
ncbi:ABC transporter substrate-binding protein [Geobacillus sp. C56-T2]|uniref:ABC transporter substrate-binding protein n=1 Tax=Geobacillus sp. C56-T2 TaxID=600773 RepID=UPI0011A55D33|nr:ABC transporter substrate-binding protein [Geobacillus sp. C56-T2]NNV06867.1 extracellular solute-binding protein [Geobacillus sp. MMMUD3]TWG30785.1 sn-glycerol 3-phosphate transport system substrate-binding protein [Geobacillus sp. C56-T2]